MSELINAFEILITMTRLRGKLLIVSSLLYPCLRLFQILTIIAD